MNARAIIASLPVLAVMALPAVASAAPTLAMKVGPNPAHRDETVNAAVGIRGAVGTVTIGWQVDGKTLETRLGDPVTEITTSFATLGAHTITVGVTDSTTGKTPVLATTTVVVANAPPKAAIAVDPGAPSTGDAIALSSASTDGDGDPLTCAWDLDGDGTFETPGCTASQSYAKAGSFTVGLRVSDGHDTDTTTVSIPVANRLPVPSFTIAPGAPLTGAAVAFDSSASLDPDGTIVARAWDLDGDGQFDDGSSPTAAFTFATPGPHAVSLQVIDDNGAAAVATQTVDVGQGAVALPAPAPAPLVLVKPPVAPVKIGATLRYAFVRTRTSAKFTSLLVRHLPAGASVKATCKGGGCPKQAFAGVAKSDSLAIKPLAGRSLKSGATITVTVAKSGMTGRTITLTVRTGKDPKLGGK